MLTAAQTIVLLTRGLDLSLGPSVSMISVGSALTMTAVLGSNAANGIVAALAGTAVGLVLGLLVGLFNGVAVAWLRVNPFVTTLASMNICLGIGTSLSDGHPVFGIPDEFNVAGYRLHVLGDADVDHLCCRRRHRTPCPIAAHRGRAIILRTR